MNATMTFDLSVPEESQLHDTYLKAPKYQDLVIEIRDKIRNFEKYEEKLTLKQFIAWLRAETDFYALVD